MSGGLFASVRPVHTSRLKEQRRRRRSEGRIHLERLEERQLLTTFVVANTLDSGPGSLRQAMLDANAAQGDDLIQFQIQGTGVQSIAVASPLPTISDVLEIDGASQDPTATSPTVEIDGAGAGSAAGLRIAAANVTIRRLSIVNFTGDAIFVSADGDDALLVGNYLGVHPDGSTLGANTGSGIQVNGADHVTIGGSATALANVISGNQQAGITLNNNTTNTLVVRNAIGVNAAGSQALGNGVGVAIQGGASFNVIGSNLQGDANVISGNTGVGVSISDASSIGNILIGNAIGTNANATVSLGNQQGGVSVSAAAQTRIGGALPGEGNTISSNGLSGSGLPGIFVGGATLTTIQGNRIGTNSGGVADLGNGGAGILIDAGSTRTRVGGTEATQGNTIAFNGRSNQAGGIVVLGNSTVGNQFLSNSLYSNQGLGIDLGGDGPTPNDGNDTDTGPNLLTNFPNISTSATGAGRTLVQGTYSGSPSTSYLVQFFASDDRDPTNFGEGRFYIGSTIVTTNIAGTGSFNETLITPTVAGQFLSATATSFPTDTGNTSEFSVGRTIGQASVADLQVTVTDDPDPAITGNELTYVAVVRNQGPNSATNVQFSQGISSTVNITSVSTTLGSVSVVSGGVSGTLGTIPAGGTVTVTVRGIPSQIGPISTNVQVFSSQIDPNPADNSRTENTTVTNPTDLVLTAAAETTPVTLSQNLIFQILVANNGNYAGTSVKVVSTLPDNANLVGVFTSQGSASVVGNLITVDLQSIAIGSAVAVRVILTPSIAGTYQQTFTVSSNEIDTAPLDNTATASAVVLPNADLGVALTSPQAGSSVISGQLVNFVAVATNNGPSAATNVSLRTTLPAGLSALAGGTITDAGGNPIGDIQINGQNVVANIGNLAAGETATLTLPATPTGTVSGLLSVVFAFPTVREQGDLNLANDTVQSSIAVETVDLSIGQTLTPPVPILNNNLTYEVVVTNNGPAQATNVVIVNTLPNDTTFVAGSAILVGAAGNVYVAAGVITATLTDPLPANTPVTLKFSVVPTAAVVLVNTAQVTTSRFDTNAANNTSTNSSAVSPADLGVVASVSNQTVFASDIGEVTYTVTNNGPAPATLTTLTIPLNSAVQVSNYQLSQGTLGSAGPNFVANLGTIAPGATATVKLQVLSPTVGAFNFTATVDSAELDNTPTNDSANFLLNVINAPGTIGFEVAALQANENAGLVTVNLVRAHGTQGTVSVQFRTTTGTAVSGVNYSPADQVVTFVDGQVVSTVTVQVLHDNVVTGNLNVGLQLSNPSGGAALGNADSLLTIVNTDIDAIPPTITELDLLGPGGVIGAFVLQFSEPIDPDRAIDPANYQLVGPNGNRLPIFQPSYNEDLRQVSITPGSNLAAGGFYRLTVLASAGTGITDLSGNRLAGNGSTAGTNFTNTFARGTNLTFIDRDGDRVNLRLRRGGVLEILRASDGNAQLVRLLGANRRSQLTGSVSRSRSRGNGVTNLGRLEGAAFGRVDNRLTTPPFVVDDQFGTLALRVRSVGRRPRRV